MSKFAIVEQDAANKLLIGLQASVADRKIWTPKICLISIAAGTTALAVKGNREPNEVFPFAKPLGIVDVDSLGQALVQGYWEPSMKDYRFIKLGIV